MKEFFVNIVEKVVDPAKQCRLTKEELATFLTVYTRVVVDGAIGLDKELRTIFERFMKILSLAILTFYLWYSEFCRQNAIFSFFKKQNRLYYLYFLSEL